MNFNASTTVLERKQLVIRTLHVQRDGNGYQNLRLELIKFNVTAEMLSSIKILGSNHMTYQIHEIVHKKIQ